MTLHGEQPEELMPGSLFGAYRIHRLLGAGGMGVVYEASQVSLQRLVALKVLAPELTGDEQSRKRFVQEGRLAARVSHPNLVRVLEVAEVGGRLMLAHELVVGETLDRRLARCGPLPVREAIEVAEVTADVLATLHDAGILHRDLKPANLFVSSDRGILVGDLGLAKDQLSCAVKTRAGNILGTPAYMAPESIQGRMATPATDLYALGIVFFECLAGHPPFSAAGAGELLRMQVSAAVPSVRPMRPELPAEFDVFLKKALAKDPAERFPSATVFSRELALLSPAAESAPRIAATRATGSGLHRATRAASDTPAVSALRPRVGPASAIDSRTRVRLSASATPGERDRRRTTVGLLLAVLALAAVLWAMKRRAAGVPVPPAVSGPRQSPESPPVVAPRNSGPKDMAQGKAWLIAPTLPGDQSRPELMAAQEALRNIHVEALRYRDRSLQNPGKMVPDQVVDGTVALIAQPFKMCAGALDDLRPGVLRGDPLAELQAARLLASVLALSAETSDDLSWMVRAWLRSGASRDPILEVRMSVQMISLLRPVGGAALPVYRAFGPLASRRGSVAWESGAACLMCLVDGVVPGRERLAQGGTPRELIERAWMRGADGVEPLDPVVCRALARAVRVANGPQASVRIYDRVWQRLLERSATAAADTSGDWLLRRELALYDLTVQRSWAVRELAAPHEDAPPQVEIRLNAWVGARDRLMRSWSYDPRDPPADRRGTQHERWAQELNAQAAARLWEIESLLPAARRL